MMFCTDRAVNYIPKHYAYKRFLSVDDLRNIKKCGSDNFPCRDRSFGWGIKNGEKGDSGASPGQIWRTY